MIAYTIYPYDARVRREAETLASCGNFDVTVCCLKENALPRSYVKEMVTIRELNLKKYIGTSQLLYIISYVRFLFKSFFACSTLFLKKKIDIVHVHNMPNFLVLAGLVPKLFGKKIILDMHDSVPDIFTAKYRDKQPGILYRLLCLEEYLSAFISDKVICVNQVQKDVTVGRGIPSEKISIFMNVPDARWFNIITKEETDSRHNGQFNLVYHGTITKRLGIDLALEAVKILATQIPGVHFHLWGNGDYLRTLKNRYIKSGNNEIVSFHRAVPTEELSTILFGMDVGVIPNRKSAATELMLPVKMLEYIGLGIPVVAPKLKAIQYYFTDEMVSYFEPDNIEDMAEAILRIYYDPLRRESQVKNAKVFLNKYGWEKQSKEFITYYLKLQE